MISIFGLSFALSHDLMSVQSFFASWPWLTWNSHVTFLMSGIILGLTAGLSPGPLQALIISQTLRYGRREGLLVALAPLMTDLPIILVTMFLLSQLSDIRPMMGWISLSGSLFLAYLAYGNLRATRLEAESCETKRSSIKTGVMTNFLNPHPYMFWLLVGAPLVLKASQTHIAWTFSFLGSFYISLLGALMAMACLMEQSRILIRGRTYIYAIRFLGILLLLFSLLFLRESFRYFSDL